MVFMCYCNIIKKKKKKKIKKKEQKKIKKKQTTIYLTPEVIKMLKIEAAMAEISYNKLIEIVLTKYIKKQKQED
jgi:predicted HicB family RNase H-like nuclease